jgi:hypothetical protein
MNFDWITTTLPIINATGIPLLSIGIILLLIAYQKSVETYKDSTTHLKDENKRVREQLSTLDSSYTDSLNKMRETVSKSMQAIGELQAAKISLLTNSNNSPAELVKSDIEKIEIVLDKLSELVDSSKRLEYYQNETSARMNIEFNNLGKIITQIGDTKSRLAIVRVIATDEVFQSISSQVSENKRGLFFSPEKKKITLEELKDLEPDEINNMLLELQERKEKSEASKKAAPELPDETS